MQWLGCFRGQGCKFEATGGQTGRTPPGATNHTSTNACSCMYVLKQTPDGVQFPRQITDYTVSTCAPTSLGRCGAATAAQEHNTDDRSAALDYRTTTARRHARIRTGCHPLQLMGLTPHPRLFGHRVGHGHKCAGSIIGTSERHSSRAGQGGVVVQCVLEGVSGTTKMGEGRGRIIPATTAAQHCPILASSCES